MKKIFTLSFFFIFAANVFASFNESRISISTLSNLPIRVMIDGREVQENNGTIQLSNLNPGYYRIQIFSGYRYNGNRDGRSRGRGTNNQQGELIYNSTLTVRYGMHTDIVINRFGRVFIDEQPIDNRYVDDDWNRNNNGGWNNYGNNNNTNWGNAMNQQTFLQLKQTVERESFDDNKLSLIKSVLPNNRVSSSQVKELVQQMSFERNKLELAKFSYRYTTDRGSYFIVNDAFSFSFSKTELAQYILSYRD